MRFRAFQTSPVKGYDLGSGVLTHRTLFLFTAVFALDLSIAFGAPAELPEPDGPGHHAPGQIGSTSCRSNDIASPEALCVQQWTLVGPPYFQFSPDSRQLLFSSWQEGSGSTISVGPISSPTNRTQLAQFGGTTRALFIGQDIAAGLIVEESLPQVKGRWSSDDPRRFWFVDTVARSKTELLKGWTGEPCWAMSPSPDGKWLVLGYWKEAKPPQRTRGLILLEIKTSKHVRIERENILLEVTGWQTNENKLIGLVYTGRDTDTNRQAFLLNLPRGSLTTAPPDLRPPDPTKMVSPDGRRAVELVWNKKLMIYDLDSGAKREFHFSPEDARQLISEHVDLSFHWATSRYLLFVREPVLLIDAETLKVSPLNMSRQPVNFQAFSPDFTYARGASRAGDWLGRVEMPSR